jgi:hypothetical protein
MLNLVVHKETARLYNINEHFASLIQRDLFFTFLSWISRLADFWFPWQAYFDRPFGLTYMKIGLDECHPIVLYYHLVQTQGQSKHNSYLNC